MPKKVYTEKWLSKFREKQSRYEVVKLKPGSMSKYAGDKMILRTAQIAEQKKAPEDQKETQNIQKNGDRYPGWITKQTCFVKTPSGVVWE